MIELKPANSGGYRVYWGNGCYSGDIYREVDGYFVWLPKSMAGSYAAHFLRAIADKLDEMNKEWDEQARRELCGPSIERTGPGYVDSKCPDPPF